MPQNGTLLPSLLEAVKVSESLQWAVLWQSINPEVADYTITWIRQRNNVDEPFFGLGPGYFPALTINHPQSIHGIESDIAGGRPVSTNVDVAGSRSVSRRNDNYPETKVSSSALPRTKENVALEFGGLIGGRLDGHRVQTWYLRRSDTCGTWQLVRGGGDVNKIMGPASVSSWPEGESRSTNQREDVCDKKHCANGIGRRDVEAKFSKIVPSTSQTITCKTFDAWTSAGKVVRKHAGINMVPRIIQQYGIYAPPARALG
ncbi:hypothetical protein FPV67DRAFT_1451889 [Lyophyllum atratum]|nr:hypothetical protein FPV67DRAFT_1451889 [Lyophyllum atratum]